MFRHSNDLRTRVISFIQKGATKSLAVKTFNLARQTVYDWISLEKLGLLEVVRPPKPIEPKVKYQLVLDYVKSNPDMYNYEIARVFGLGTETVRKILIKYGISVKKTDNLYRS